MFIPVYGMYRWWLVLKQFQTLQQRAGLGVVMSPARAFWLSSMWFGSAVYVNKHVNALYFFKQGHSLGRQVGTAPEHAVTPPPVAPAATISPVPQVPQIQPAPTPGDLPQAI